MISEFTLCFFLSLPALFDPILQIYFIVPYRKAVLKLVTCGRIRVDAGASREFQNTSLMLSKVCQFAMAFMDTCPSVLIRYSKFQKQMSTV
uniref:Secreted protein n=1 Tax=Caenorhabditis tropicalis TaxID=1561998 RepID=A0A1I7T1L1_9PELO